MCDFVFFNFCNFCSQWSEFKVGLSFLKIAVTLRNADCCNTSNTICMKYDKEVYADPGKDFFKLTE